MFSTDYPGLTIVYRFDTYQVPQGKHRNRFPHWAHFTDPTMFSAPQREQDGYRLEPQTLQVFRSTELIERHLAHLTVSLSSTVHKFTMRFLSVVQTLLGRTS